MKYLITHITHYDYVAPVPECFNSARLTPRELPHQSCNLHDLQISPMPADRSTGTDYFGNHVEYFSIHEPFESLTVTAKNEIEVTSTIPPVAASTLPWETILQQSPATDLLANQFSYDSLHIRTNHQFAEYAKPSFSAGRPVLEAALDLTSRIHKDFEFNQEATTVSTPVEEVFEKRAGVCQDFTHFQIACLRSLGLPARYVSGYLRTLPPPGKPRLVGADASHAWVSVYCGPDVGWIDLDPTNNVIPNTDHLTLAWGRDYFDVCPIQGVFTGGGRTILEVSVDVMPLDNQ